MILLKPSLILLLVFNINFVFAETNDYTKGLIRSDSTFKCEGIALIDQGMALDRPGLFFDEPTQDYLCSYGMAGNQCSFTGVGQPCVCPPEKWTKNKCWEKYSQFQKHKKQ